VCVCVTYTFSRWSARDSRTCMTKSTRGAASGFSDRSQSLGAALTINDRATQNGNTFALYNPHSNNIIILCTEYMDTIRNVFVFNSSGIRIPWGGTIPSPVLVLRFLKLIWKDRRSIRVFGLIARVKFYVTMHLIKYVQNAERRSSLQLPSLTGNNHLNAAEGYFSSTVSDRQLVKSQANSIPVSHA